MSLQPLRVKQLEALCRQFRRDVLHTLYEIQTGHPGGSLSVCEILTVLYLETANLSPDAPEQRDRIVLTKGHAAPMLYRILAEKAFFPQEELATLRQLDSRLQGHPCMNSTPGVELSTGPLGIGLSACVGMAMGLRLDGIKARVFAVMGDGELDEGTVWEAAMSAAKFRLDNLTVVVDNNGVQLDGTNDQIMPLGDLGAKFSAFGFHVLHCDGHDVSQLCNAFSQAAQVKGCPAVILAKTVKGKGVSFMEGQSSWHGRPLTETDYRLAMEELEEHNDG